MIAVTRRRWPCLLHPYITVGRGRWGTLDIVRKKKDEGPSFMVYLVCALIDLGGWGETKHGLERLQSAPWHADVRSHLSGFSALFSHWLQVRKVGTVYLKRITHTYEGYRTLSARVKRQFSLPCYYKDVTTTYLNKKEDSRPWDTD